MAKKKAAAKKATTAKTATTATSETQQWKVSRPEEPPPSTQLGFLQLCIERRFHRVVQEAFEQVTGLNSYDYWAHTDFGGTPKMQHEEDRPGYAYGEGARIMGWSAHGTVCGAFKPDKHPHKAKDAEIREALLSEFRRKVFMYPEAEHYVFFATQDKASNKPVVWWRGPIRAF